VTDYIDARYELTEELAWLAAQPVSLLGEASLDRRRDELLLVRATRRDRGRNVGTSDGRAGARPYRLWPGNVSVTFVPAPSSLSARARPPCNSMIDFTMASPSPVLAELELRAASTR
jgi:hypothetical protein